MLEEGARGARYTAGPLATAAFGQSRPKLLSAIDERPERTVPARPAERVVDAEELDELIARFGLGARRDDLLGLARTSMRLTPAEHPAGWRSCLFPGAAPPRDAGEPAWNGRPLHMLAQIDLSELPPLGPGRPALPRAGLLLLMWALDGAPTGLSTAHAGSTAVVHLLPARKRLRRRAVVPAGARPVRLSAELSLPRVWASSVARLDLTEAEQERWQLLRDELATRQGLPEAAAGEAPESGETVAVHRLCGYPDERRGHMRQACEAAARGIDLGDGPPYEHPQARELEAREDRWELLFQLSLDSDLGWDWGAMKQRLYVWIDREDLQRADFSGAWGIAQ